jgi:subtilisin family serine protease
MFLLLSLFIVLTLGRAPLLGTNAPKIDDEYIVIYNNDIDTELIIKHQESLSLNIFHTYNISSLFRGFAAHLDEEELIRVLDTPFVKEVHCNGIEHAGQCDITQDPVDTWGLARVSYQGSVESQDLPELFKYHSRFTGAGVYLYILDTGVYREHREFATGRIREGANFVDGQPPAYVDQNGHGSHCAGTAAGNNYGIARSASIIPVKVLGASGSGATSGVIKGIEYVAINHADNGGPSIGSMSLGSASDGGKNAAIAAAVARGCVFVVAAGNNNQDACYYYPASSPDAITVGATTMGANNEDTRASFSNWGTCVDVFAPGQSIPSAGHTTPTSISVKSGTSMACPHVAGYCAVLLSENRNLTPVQVKRLVQDHSNADVIYSPGTGSPNLLLHNNCPH